MDTETLLARFTEMRVVFVPPAYPEETGFWFKVTVEGRTYWGEMFSVPDRTSTVKRWKADLRILEKGSMLCWPVYTSFRATSGEVAWGRFLQCMGSTLANLPRSKDKPPCPPTPNTSA